MVDMKQASFFTLMFWKTIFFSLIVMPGTTLQRSLLEAMFANILALLCQFTVSYVARTLLCRLLDQSLPSIIHQKMQEHRWFSRTNFFMHSWMHSAGHSLFHLFFHGFKVSLSQCCLADNLCRHFVLAIQVVKPKSLSSFSIANVVLHKQFLIDKHKITSFSILCCKYDF